MKAASALAVMLFLVLFSVGVRAEEPQAGEGLDALFRATMMGIDGEPMTLAGFRNKPLIVNFWARWCVPCRDEIPELVEFQAKYKKQGLVVLGVALEDDPVKVSDFLKAYSVNYPVALVGDTGLSLMQKLGNEIMGLPFTLFINKKGEVVWVKRGILKKSDLQENVKKLL